MYTRDADITRNIENIIYIRVVQHTATIRNAINYNSTNRNFVQVIFVNANKQKKERERENTAALTGVFCLNHVHF